MNRALPSHLSGMVVWSGNSVLLEGACVQTVVGQNLSFKKFLSKKAVTADPKAIASSVSLELEI